jgi:hypothetical protein
VLLLHYCLAWCCDQDGTSAVLLACSNGHLDIVRWLVTDVGSDVRSERSDVSCRCRCVRAGVLIVM